MLIVGCGTAAFPWLLVIFVRLLRHWDLLAPGMEAVLGWIDDLHPMPALTMLVVGGSLVITAVVVMLMRLAIYTIRKYPL
jgi:hypothetical protein